MRVVTLMTGAKRWFLAERRAVAEGIERDDLSQLIAEAVGAKAAGDAGEAGAKAAGAKAAGDAVGAGAKAAGGKAAGAKAAGAKAVFRSTAHWLTPKTVIGAMYVVL